MFKIIALLLSIFVAICSYSQRGKDNSYTVTTANTQLNAYTAVTANAIAGATSITVASNNLTNTFFSTALGPGDLIMIIQMQGATMDVDVTATASWGGHYTTPNGHLLDWGTNQDLWGNVTSYNNAGKYELVEVKSVSGSTTIQLMCGLQNAYTASGHVQVVRVPRLQNLTVNSNTSVVPSLWNGTTGGVVALEVLGTLTLSSNGKILATGYGFRGGVCDIQTAGSPPSNAANVGYCASDAAAEGAEKGEGIGGFYTEYDALYSRYCKSAPANGGGGGGNHNAGGGGGSNVGVGAYSGKGNPTNYAAFWNLELSGFATSTSSGGGRGGYSYATLNANEATIGPNNTAWGGDYRRAEGGLGGHPLSYDATRIFMGGGGGAGDANSNPTQGGAGGNGGGIVFLTLYGTVTGTGTIEANGAPGQNANASGLVAPVNSSTKYGNDAAGGAGGGGAIVISNGTAIPAGITLSANGGDGGNQVISCGSFASPVMEADGPGGGGAGGMIAFSSGAPVQTVTGGANGTTNSSYVNLFPPNGATSGGSGMSGIVQPYFDITSPNVTICKNTSTTLTATVVGTLPASASLTWYSTQFGTTVLGTGASFTTPVLTATTTYYVGTCPGTFRVPVTVTVAGPGIIGAVLVTNANCNSGGSIVGLIASGGTAPLTYSWNGIATPGMSLSNATPGSYTVLVTDAAGCTISAGPYVISSIPGPSLNTASVALTGTPCGASSGSITGITATGTSLTYAWSNGANTLDITGLGVGNYTLTVTDNLGCTATAGPYTINTPSGPTINAGSLTVQSATCGNPNGSITGITAYGSSLTYSWNGVVSPGPNLTNATAGNYTLTVTDNAGCASLSGPYTIADQPLPYIDLTGMVVTADHCGLGDGTITGIQVYGVGPIVCNWPGNGSTTPDAIGMSPGTYVLTVTDANGCSSVSTPISITSVPGPSIDDTTALTITPETCLGNDGSITGITATGTNLTYSWNNLFTLGPDTTGLAAGNYTLVVTDPFGCTDTAGPFIVAAPLALTIDSTNLLITPASCLANDGQITGLAIAGGVNPVFNWSNGSLVLDMNGLAAAVYTLSITDDQNCTVISNFTVPASVPPLINTALLTNPLCSQSNGSIDVAVTGGLGVLSYSIDNGLTIQDSGTFINLIAGSYTVLVVDQAGCTADTTVVLTTTPAPLMNSVQQTDPICGLNNGVIIISASGGGGGFMYSIDSAATFIASDTITNLSAGVYVVLVQDGNNCQTASQTITLASQNIPVVNAGQDQTVCSGQPVTLVASGTLTYAWTNNVTNGVAFTPPNTNTYVVTGTDALGCTDTDTVLVTVNPSPVVSATASVSEGCPPLTVDFQNTTPNSGDVIWQFSNGSTMSGTVGQSVTFNNIGCVDLTLSVVATNGCQSSQQFNDIVCLYDKPIAKFVPSPAVMTAFETNAVMHNESVDAIGYTWNFADGTSSTQVNPSHTFPLEQAGVYPVTLVVINTHGCTDTATMLVTVNEELIYYVPNSFTPNDDEFNSRFTPVFTSGFSPADYLFQIYNRWGEVVFESSDYLEGWDGTTNGLMVPDGVYTYRIEFKTLPSDARELVTGSVTLLR